MSTPSNAPQSLISTADRQALAAFPFLSADVLRYGDTDRQGHVNNAVYATFFETGRITLMNDALGPESGWGGHEFVIVKLTVEFLSEVRWPGTVVVGSRVAHIGTSSVTVEQELSAAGHVSARAQSVMVQIDTQTRASAPFSDAARAALERCS